MIKSRIKNLFRKGIFCFRQMRHERFYRDLMGQNGISNKEVTGEKEWLRYWSRLGVKAKPTQYRVFSHYIGADVKIVPEDICHDFIEPILNPFRFVGYYADKNVFDKLFPDGFMPKTLLRRMGGFYFDALYRPVEVTDMFISEILGSMPTGRAILKPSVGGMSGRGVCLLEAKAGGVFLGDQKVDKEFLDNYGRDFIIQEAVSQSDYISQFNPTSVNTLRLSVYRSVKDNQCHVTGAIMRIGGKGSVVDNAHAGGCYVGIHADGTFCHEVLDQYGHRRTVFNEVDFSRTYQYPNWQQVLEFGKRICEYVPHHRLLALDVVLDKNNQPHLIEFNVLYYSPWLFQYTTGPAFGDYTDEIVNYCLEHRKELENILYY